MNVEPLRLKNMILWLYEKIKLDSYAQNSSHRSVHRGEVYWCSFGYGIGSEIQKKRPAVIIQNDVGNERLANIIVVPITHGQASRSFAIPIEEKKGDDGNIILDGNASTANISCFSKARLGDYICSLSSNEMKEIDKAIARSLGIMHYYEDLNSKLNDKIEFINRLKMQRNEAQDLIKEFVEQTSKTCVDPLIKLSRANLERYLDDDKKV